MNTPTQQENFTANDIKAPEKVIVPFSIKRYLISLMMIVIVILAVINPASSYLIKSFIVAGTIFTVYINLIRPLFVYKGAVILKPEGLENYSYPFATDDHQIPWSNIKEIKYTEFKILLVTERNISIYLHDRSSLLSQLKGLQLSKVNSYLKNKNNLGEINIPLAHIANYDQNSFIELLENYKAQALAFSQQSETSEASQDKPNSYKELKD